MHASIRDNASVPVRRVYDKVTNSDSGDSDEVQQFSSFRSRLKRYRAKFVPALPTDIDDVDIHGEWARTRTGQPFLNRLDNHWGLAIFTTSRLLTALTRSECVYIDGTFRTAPHPYTQFVTVHGLYHGFVVPMVFCLLNGKTVAQYRQLFQSLKREIRRMTGHAWKPDRFVLDFEFAMFIAIQTELPRVPISGCYFHYTQSLWRHIQDNGLVVAYRTNRRLRNLVRRVMAIGYLPVLVVRQNFIMLRNSILRQYETETVSRFVCVKRPSSFSKQGWQVMSSLDRSDCIFVPHIQSADLSKSLFISNNLFGPSFNDSCPL